MKLLGKPIQNINSEDIIYLINNEIQESISLDYKRSLPGNSDSEKKELLADISSFANTTGGVIVYGLEEQKDGTGKNLGFPKKVAGLGEINLDLEKQRLENIIRDGLDPRLNNIYVKDINVDGNSVLLVGIPRSLLAPHMICFKRDGKFYSRNNSGKYQMDAREIRQSYLQNDEWEKKADSFRRERIMAVRSLEFIPNLDTEAMFFLHIIPLGLNRSYIDINKHLNDLPDLFDGVDGSCRFNLDGYLVYDMGEKCNAFVQYFRDGGVEIYSSYMFSRYAPDSLLQLNATDSETFTIVCVKKYLNYIPLVEVELPIVIYLTYINLLNVSINKNHIRQRPRMNLFDRKDVILPGVVVESMENDITEILHPVFDMIWQAAGWVESPNYKERSKSL